MPNTILTPVTLWKDFDESLPFHEETIAEKTEGEFLIRDFYFYGRKTDAARVKIYARYYRPVREEKFPAVMILFEAGFPFDETLAMRFASRGYGVLCVDYCGKRAAPPYTVYPQAVEYANYADENDLIRCDKTARETCWYEWAAVARYAARYLSELKEVTAVGAIGLRTGGEILFKIAPYAKLDCMVSVCAAGWLAYRGIEKFSSEQEKRIFNEESRRFIAGLDSQTYAPFVKCPVLLLSAINDKKYNYDRVYDTFIQINPEVEKALLFSAHGNGLLGSHSLADMDLFFDKYLRAHSVFLTKPLTVSWGENEAGDLVVNVKFDPAGDIKEYGVFFTENVSAFKTRDWTRVLGDMSALDNNAGSLPLSLYEGTKKALVYVFVNYSNNFSVTSKIFEVNVTKRYANTRLKSRIIYAEEDGHNGFSAFRRRATSIADCFADGATSEISLTAGYGGILGVTSPAGIITYRVGEPRYEAPEGASFRFDAYAPKETELKVSFYRDDEEKAAFTCTVHVEGGGKWKSVMLEAADFKSDLGAPLSSFTGVISVVFSGEEVLVTNVLWI